MFYNYKTQRLKGFIAEAACKYVIVSASFHWHSDYFILNIELSFRGQSIGKVAFVVYLVITIESVIVLFIM